MDPRDAQQWKAMGMLSSIGLTLAFSTIIGAGLGWLVDHFFHTTPWGVAGGAVVGSAAGFMEMIKVVSQANRDD